MNRTEEGYGPGPPLDIYFQDTYLEGITDAKWPEDDIPMSSAAHEWLTVAAHFSPNHPQESHDWSYPEELDPESIHSWTHQFTATSKVREYVLALIQQGEIGIEINQPRNSQAAIIIETNSGNSIAITLKDPSLDLPTVNYRDAALIIEHALWKEKRSFEGTWLHEKRSAQNLQDLKTLSANQISLLTLFADFDGGYREIPLEDLFEGFPELLIWIEEQKDRKHYSEPEIEPDGISF